MGSVLSGRCSWQLLARERVSIHYLWLLVSIEEKPDSYRVAYLVRATQHIEIEAENVCSGQLNEVVSVTQPSGHGRKKKIRCLVGGSVYEKGSTSKGISRKIQLPSMGLCSLQWQKRDVFGGPQTW